MRLPQFNYLEPESIKEASSLLTEKGAAVIAGGTDLLVNMKKRVITPKYLVNLKHIEELKGLAFDETKGLRIGALTTLDVLSKSTLIKEKYPALAQATGRTAAPQLRNMATIGGNVCLESMCMYYNQSAEWMKSRIPCFKRGGNQCYVAKGSKECVALFEADTPPALLSLGARVKIVGNSQERVLPLADIYTQKGQKANNLAPTEFVQEILIPAPPKNSGSAYQKMSQRESIDFPILGVASQLTIAGGKCREVKIAMTAVVSGPIRVKEAEEALSDQAVTDELIAKAATIAQEKVRPLSHQGISAWYKRKLIGVLVKGSLKQAWDLAK